MMEERRGSSGLMRDKRGVAAVEFAIVAPLFILFIGGILLYGIYFATIHSLQQLVAEAGRATIAGLSDSERSTLARAQIDGTIANYGILRREFIQVQTATDPLSSDRYTVSVTYDASHLGLNAFAAFLPQPPNSIARTAIIRKGGG